MPQASRPIVFGPRPAQPELFLSRVRELVVGDLARETREVSIWWREEPATGDRSGQARVGTDPLRGVIGAPRLSDQENAGIEVRPGARLVEKGGIGWRRGKTPPGALLAGDDRPAERR